MWATRSACPGRTTGAPGGSNAGGPLFVPQRAALGRCVGLPVTTGARPPGGGLDHRRAAP